MTDRELLELAAKAAGVKGYWEEPSGNVKGGWVIGLTGCSCGLDKACVCDPFSYWNPLTDDGDALRLAVKLGINVWRDDDVIYTGHKIQWRLDSGDDPYAATRRAIVRAAAEIGMDMK